MGALVKSFGFGEQLVRVVERADEYWFVANDVCAALELANPRDVVAKLDNDERDDVGLADAIGRDQRTTIISEGGMYTIVLRSRDAVKPGTVAYRFRKWVTGEVLPALRREGRYELEPVANDELARQPEAPDEFDRERLNLQMVREARIVFGAAAARRIWALRGLPDLSAPEPPTLPAMIHAEQYRPVGDWMRDRVTMCSASRVRSMELYGDYVDWCRRQGVEPLSQIAFSRYLTSCGIGRAHSEVSWRTGIRLRT
ncbi:BRO-N domain-containing protein [Rhizorhabdus histidinilytica]|uniref:BRO-N domain-containing protein n=1 Tax=Rhizorhabdus histidinilytica TaxID=439228 RepID=UPI00069BB0AB|nr:Bro-N domain-containing protein [Sphingomonas sp. Y57]